MQKITFENLPSTNTPINATNLNAIQTNVESEITRIDNAISQKGRATIHDYNSSQQSATSLTKVTNMELTLTTYGGDVFVSVSIPFYQSAGTGNLQIYVDGTGQGILTRTNATSNAQLHGETILTNLSSGSHTFEVRMTPQSGNTCYCGTYIEKILTVIEL